MDSFLEIAFPIIGIVVILSTLALPGVVLALRGSSRSKADQDTYPRIGLAFVLVGAIYGIVASFAVVGASDAEWQRSNTYIVCFALLTLSFAFALVACRLLRTSYYSAVIFLVPTIVVSVLVIAGDRLLASYLIVPLPLICGAWIVFRWIQGLRQKRQVEAT